MDVPFVHVLKITLAARRPVGQNVPSILNVSSIKHVSIINVSTHVHRRHAANKHAVKLSITIQYVVVHWALRAIHLFVVYPKKVSLCTLHTFAFGSSALNSSIHFLLQWSSHYLCCCFVFSFFCVFKKNSKLVWIICDLEFIALLQPTANVSKGCGVCFPFFFPLCGFL